MDRDMGKTQTTIARDARVVEMFRAGKSIKDIALAVGRHRTTVAQVIRDFLGLERNAERQRRLDEENAPIPPRPRGFGVVRAPKLKIPELIPGTLYEFPALGAKGGRRYPAFRMRFWKWAPGAEGMRHALFRHPTTGTVEAFREFDLQRVRMVS
jgi:hypothetical protein